MRYTKEFDIYTFEFWGGAKDTIERVQALGMMSELEGVVNEVFYGRAPTDTEINDFVWFDTDTIGGYLGFDLWED